MCTLPLPLPWRNRPRDKYEIRTLGGGAAVRLLLGAFSERAAPAYGGQEFRHKVRGGARGMANGGLLKERYTLGKARVRGTPPETPEESTYGPAYAVPWQLREYGPVTHPTRLDHSDLPSFVERTRNMVPASRVAADVREAEEVSVHRAFPFIWLAKPLRQQCLFKPVVVTSNGKCFCDEGFKLASGHWIFGATC